jgi:hypothetical protein
LHQVSFPDSLTFKIPSKPVKGGNAGFGSLIEAIWVVRMQQKRQELTLNDSQLLPYVYWSGKPEVEIDDGRWKSPTCVMDTAGSKKGPLRLMQMRQAPCNIFDDPIH